MSRPARPAATERSGLLARSAALAAAGCGLAHVLLLAGGAVGWTAAAHFAMTVACLPCAVHLWRRPGAGAWAAHAAVSVLMLVAHPVATALGGHVHHAGPEPAAVAWAGTAVPVLAGAALLLGAFRFWLGYDVPAQAGAFSGRRVPQA